MTVYPRLRMRLSLTEQNLPGSFRNIRPEDASTIGTLMLVAYHGTVDDEGETESDAIAEVERTIRGAYGPFLHDCSFVADDGEGRPIGASMISLFEREPFLTYLIVHPEMQRQGIATSLVAASGKALLSAGHSQVQLFVTEANDPAANLYRKLGFEVVDRILAPE